MALKIRQRSDLKRPLEILEGSGFRVMVRHLGPEQTKELERLTTVEKFDRASGAMQPSIDWDKWKLLAPEYLIDASGCDGLTNGIIRRLGIDLEEDLPADSNGFVECTLDVLRDLWVNAHAEKFPAPIQRFSREMLSFVEAEKKRNQTH